MGTRSKTFFLLLILIALIANVSILAIEPVSGKSNTAPTISIVFPTNETVFNASIEGIFFKVQYETNDTLSWVGYSIDDGRNVTITVNSTTEHDFDFGYSTLTLYANDTDGNWAIPQTVTYLANFYPDTTLKPTATSSPTVTSTSTPTTIATPTNSVPNIATPTQDTNANASTNTAVPEFSLLTIPILLGIMLATAGLLVYHKKHKQLSKGSLTSFSQ
jgi:hypothetical protein